MRRRNFLQNSLAVAGLATLPACTTLFPKDQHLPRFTKKPLAINMWDFSWLTRQYKDGGFEDIDFALDGLQERGYNALRIDCFPQFIAYMENGKFQNEFDLPAVKKDTVLWGNKKAVRIHPRKALKSFITKCDKRNIKLVLSSWFLDHGTGVTRSYQNEESLFNAWSTTIEFLQEHELLKNVLYIDLLNEFPLWHGFKWLDVNLKKYSLEEKSKKGPYDFLAEKGPRFNKKQIDFYNQFINQTILKLKAKWPGLLFMASQTNTHNVPWKDLKINNFDALDIHCWFNYNNAFSTETEYYKTMHILNPKMNYKAFQENVDSYWKIHKTDLVTWMEEQIIMRKEAAARLKVPYGNTEGWGTVVWMDHKDLNFKFIKEAGIIGAQLGHKHQMAFNCSSNFNHPHFSIWEDIKWHQEVTKMIKHG